MGVVSPWLGDEGQALVSLDLSPGSVPIPIEMEAPHQLVTIASWVVLPKSTLFGNSGESEAPWMVALSCCDFS